ncbi:MAG: PhzF family phenazine biosynthesis protein [Clostridiales Family XIII bacterium]|jgi:PhzF family phenazine biosynthesis protein|nr:PhzF family phenazine biosynthesis protein [Clostridiales Family XIII bacterium]
MKFFIVDAFADEAFAGNPAGVVILPDAAAKNESLGSLSDEAMRKIAAELRYSETAFVRILGDGVFETRYFTPAAEVELCGHATIAAFHALSEAGLIRGDGAYTNKTLAGDLRIEIKEGAVWMDMAPPRVIRTICDSAEIVELYSVMGIETKAINSIGGPVKYFTMGGSSGEAGADLYPEIVSTGLPDIILPMASREQLNAIKPDFPALAALSKRHEVTGVHAFFVPAGNLHIPEVEDSCRTSETEGCCANVAEIYCRNFAPLYGIDEEAATGTANGALTYYLYERGIVKPGVRNRFRQGDAMGRSSIVETRLTADAEGNVSIKVGGHAVTLASGEMNESAP